MERNSREGSPASGVTAKSQSTVPIPQRIESMIDPAVWGNWAIDLTNASPQQLGSYMGFLLETYEKRNLTGLELWNEVSPDFADWSEEEEPEAEIPQQEVVRDEIIVAGGGSEPDEPQEAPEPPRRRPGRPRKRPLPIAHFTEEFNDDPDYQQIFLSIKEQADEELAIKLRREGVITTPGEPFEQSTKQEINSLIARGVFKFTQFNKRRHQNVRIFRSRIVNEVKGKTTEPYEKSRLVIQGYADDGKKAILTQSPTIQRASQRLILSITPSLLREGKQLWLRDITQAYVQSSTRLNRTILAYPPKQIQDQYPKGTIMEVVKPLYGIAEAGTHW
ncbi:uncharacterized protein CTRU02_202504 [Colletotrichum truncatum]|uniref:Uncharacterized protein n=1 Tax=Colletotrichum truncatum TaxID=5467 RepID=A0ACC3ZL05_COLTU|nr:uncharacterized protein CTRU02_01674 [Colletotrichum truncatum]KAF6799995.1 hypothetical protein CTRU02_01674 [Colletotrichum truncatum]